jgi:hypothetical protein
MFIVLKNVLLCGLIIAVVHFILLNHMLGYRTMTPMEIESLGGSTRPRESGRPPQHEPYADIARDAAAQAQLLAEFVNASEGKQKESFSDVVLNSDIAKLHRIERQLELRPDPGTLAMPRDSTTDDQRPAATETSRCALATVDGHVVHDGMGLLAAAQGVPQDHVHAYDEYDCHACVE